MASGSLTDSAKKPGLTWSWDRAFVGVVYAIPAAVVTLQDPVRGIPLALGVLPAAIIPMPARRPARIVILLLGVLVGASLLLGGVLAHLPTLVTAGVLAAVVVGSALLASVAPRGMIALTLCAPLVAAGLSYSDFGTSVETFLLLSAGAAYAWLVSLAWPSRTSTPRLAAELPPRALMVSYGIRMGVAAALAFLISSSLGLDHSGWAPAACLLVARPQLDLLKSRGIGRVVSVICGAAAAGVLVHIDASNLAYAVIAVVVLTATAATVGSRWYITAAFTTFFVFLMLLNGNPEQTTQKFNERVGETLLGVGLAFIFGWALPTLMARSRSG